MPKSLPSKPREILASQKAAGDALSQVGRADLRNTLTDALRENYLLGVEAASRQAGKAITLDPNKTEAWSKERFEKVAHDTGPLQRDGDRKDLAWAYTQSLYEAWKDGLNHLDQDQATSRFQKRPPRASGLLIRPARHTVTELRDGACRAILDVYMTDPDQPRIWLASSIDGSSSWRILHASASSSHSRILACNGAQALDAEVAKLMLEEHQIEDMGQNADGTARIWAITPLALIHGAEVAGLPLDELEGRMDSLKAPRN